MMQLEVESASVNETYIVYGGDHRKSRTISDPACEALAFKSRNL